MNGRAVELLGLYASAPEAFWRHDIDMSIPAAVQMARIGQLAGVSTTFYVDVESEIYNASSRSALNHLNEIAQRGHRLGLHVDYRPEFGDPDPRKAYNRARSRAPLGLRLLCDTRLSWHMPPEDVLWRSFAWCDSAYSSEWAGRYLSDSRGRELERAPTNDDQVVLHPEWWFPTSTEGVC